MSKSPEAVNIANIIFVVKFLKKTVSVIIITVYRRMSSLLTRGALTVNLTYSFSGV